MSAKTDPDSLDDSDGFEPMGGDAATGSVSSDNASFEGGEIELFLQSVDDNTQIDLAPAVKEEMQQALSDFGKNGNNKSFYGHPLSPEEALARMPEGDDGLKWHALVIPDSFFSEGRLKKGLDLKDFDYGRQEIKPRRPSLPITVDSLFKSLTKIEGSNGPRYIFSGVLNGWPALKYFELIKLEQKRQASNIIPSPREILKGQISWVPFWRSYVDGAKGTTPTISDENIVYRATFRAAPWTSKGWSVSSPGFAFWYEPHRPVSEQRVTYGTNMLTQLADSDSKCTQLHMISHRYAVKRESTVDRITYHSIVLLEWEHGKYSTVVETAYLNGMGGFKGKSNWIDDRDEEPSGLYKAMLPEMIMPWRMTSAEIRCYDVPYKKLEEFKSFVMKYEGSHARFIDPQFSFSHPARLTFRTKTHIAQYLLNYIQRDSSYAELKRNCQTFVADFCAFLAGKRHIAPFHPVSRVEYTNRTYLFLYDSHLYESKDERKKKERESKRESKTSPKRSSIFAW